MGRSQSDLDEILKGFSTNTYFDPPSNLQMDYPCIRYQLGLPSDTKFADNKPYNRTKRYEVTVIHRDAISDISEKVADLPMCTHQTSFTAENLHHDVFNLFF